MILHHVKLDEDTFIRVKTGAQTVIGPFRTKKDLAVGHTLELLNRRDHRKMRAVVKAVDSGGITIEPIGTWKDPVAVQISRYVSLLLRHDPQGLTMDTYGWVAVDELIALVGKTHPFTRDRLFEMVREDEKGRYALSADHTKIRANYGHSLPRLQNDLQAEMPPEWLFHGTAEAYTASILAQGILPQKRNFVHLSVDAETAFKVGSRHGDPVLLHVHSGKMHREGFRFFRSASGIWLTKIVPPGYVHRL